MTKSLPIKDREETVTIPKASFDAMFRVMEQMRDDIEALNKELSRMRESLLEKVPKEKEPLFSVNEAAEYCGVARQTISLWVRQKKIKKVRRGGKTGFLRSELDKERDIT